MKIYDDLKKFQTKTKSQSFVFKEFSHRRTNKSFAYLFGEEKLDTSEAPEYPNSKRTPLEMSFEDKMMPKGSIKRMIFPIVSGSK